MCVARLAVGRRVAAGVAGRALAAVTVTCVWFHLVGVQPVVVWQLKQLVRPTGTWVDDLPVVVEPLWQLAQLVEALKVEWSTLADQVLVDLWQLSQLPRHARVDRIAGFADCGQVAAGVAGRAVGAPSRWRETWPASRR
jgi:hypothetical protein